MHERTENKGGFQVITKIGKATAEDDKPGSMNEDFQDLKSEVDSLLDRLQQIYLWTNTFDEA